MCNVWSVMAWSFSCSPFCYAVRGLNFPGFPGPSFTSAQCFPVVFPGFIVCPINFLTLGARRMHGKPKSAVERWAQPIAYSYQTKL